MILVGMKESCGTFTDKKSKEPIDYHNVVMYVSDEITGKDVVGSFGSSVQEIKVKGAFLDSAFGGHFQGLQAYEKYLGTEIKVRYSMTISKTAITLSLWKISPKRQRLSDYGRRNNCLLRA